MYEPTFDPILDTFTPTSREEWDRDLDEFVSRSRAIEAAALIAERNALYDALESQASARVRKAILHRLDVVEMAVAAQF